MISFVEGNSSTMNPYSIWIAGFFFPQSSFLILDFIFFKNKLAHLQITKQACWRPYRKIMRVNMRRP